MADLTNLIYLLIVVLIIIVIVVVLLHVILAVLGIGPIGLGISPDKILLTTLHS